MADRVLKPINKGDTVVVVGLGKSGLSAIRFFLSLGANVKLSDSSSAPSKESVGYLASLNIEVEFGTHSEEFFNNADLVMISPGVPWRLKILKRMREKGVPVFGELALASCYLKTPVIAITGTNGKTTTTTLIGEIVKASGKSVFVGGNIGTPLTDYLMGDQDDGWLVLEVSSFQLDASGDFRPDIGILLNITPDHLDRYESMHEYAISKFNLFEHQTGTDVAILNSDDPEIVKLIQGPNSIMHEKVGENCIKYFGKDPGDDGSVMYTNKGVKCLFGADEYEFDLSGTVFGNFPNLENAAAAIIGCISAGCSHEAITNGINKFKPLAHRMSFAGEVKGVRYFNDSKATNTGAVEAALRAFDNPVVLIAGGRDKGGEFNALRKVVKEKVKCMLLIGEAKNVMAEHFCKLTSVQICSSLPEAVKKAGEVSVEGDVVLFSPACASFDMFRSYAHRGEVFEQIISGMAA